MSTPIHRSAAPFILALVGGTLLACPPPRVEAPQTNSPEVEEVTLSDLSHDIHSFANSDEVKVKHLDLDLTVDFASQKLHGEASLHLADHGASELHLDTRDLDIGKVTLDDAEQPVDFSLGEPVAFLGQELVIPIDPETRVVHIEYSTRPEAAALQWLSPEQTAGGAFPFLYTQSQAILARTWVPLQDTPAVRMTYDATVKVPRHLMALMSASNPTQKSADGVYHFSMPQPIPSYLLALAVGDLEFRAIGESTGVYAEPSEVEAAAWELGQTQAMVEAVEALYGPYLWGRFDVLVLPPSFPFGGMENPRLTFATPTIIAGDRSLVALIAHELAHSWSGNLVTNATWNDFWLNEGFTVYLERRIMEAIRGEAYAEMLASLGLQDLQGEVEALGSESRDTHLHLDLAGRNPDDGMTDVAYEKGYLFLRMLEEAVGRERWDDFLRQYFDRHRFQSLNTRQFLIYLDENLLSVVPDLDREALRIEEWVYGPGIPENAPRIESAAFSAVEAELAAWLGGKDAAQLATGEWTTHEWLHFLRQLPESLTAAQMAALDAALGLSESGNSEILAEWLGVSIENRYQPAYPALAEFLTGMGRRKFLTPLYTLLVDTEQRAVAVDIYQRARPGYHSVSRETIDQILGWGKAEPTGSGDTVGGDSDEERDESADGAGAAT